MVFYDINLIYSDFVQNTMHQQVFFIQHWMVAPPWRILTSNDEGQQPFISWSTKYL